MARKRWDFDDTSPASFAEVRRLIETAFNYKQFADSLTEPVRKQLLADFMGTPSTPAENPGTRVRAASKRALKTQLTPRKTSDGRGLLPHPVRG